MLNDTQSGKPTILRRDEAGPRPLSFPQERLFLLDRLMPGLGAYNVPVLVGVHGTLDDELLRRALERVVERQEILRSSIRLVDGLPAQVVMPNRRFELESFDVRELPEGEREQRVHDLLSEVVQRPFDLAEDVLMRAGLVHLSEDEDRLLIVLHHIGSDHVSSKILFAELDAIYSAYADGREPDLPELPIQYADYAAWQREQLGGEHLEELIDYWRTTLKGAPERLDLPFDRPRPGVQSYRGKLQEFTIPSELVSPLRAVARQNGVSMYMLLNAAFNVLVHRYTGVEDIVLGGPSSGRHHLETVRRPGAIHEPDVPEKEMAACAPRRKAGRVCACASSCSRSSETATSKVRAGFVAAALHASPLSWNFHSAATGWGTMDG